jgi:hypothetical protein
MTSFNPSPKFEYYFKACLRTDREAKPVAVGWSASGVIADASEITGLPRDEFIIFEISKSEFEAFRPT